MPIKKALAFDTLTKRWIGKVPVTWFDQFPHLAHTDSDGRRLARSSTAPAAPVPPPRPADKRSVKELRARAESLGLDLGHARTKAAILAALADAEAAAATTPDEAADPATDPAASAASTEGD